MDLVIRLHTVTLCVLFMSICLIAFNVSQAQFWNHKRLICCINRSTAFPDYLYYLLVTRVSGVSKQGAMIDQMFQNQSGFPKIMCIENVVFDQSEVLFCVTTIALCRYPSTCLWDRYKPLRTGRNMGGGVNKWRNKKDLQKPHILLVMHQKCL